MVRKICLNSAYGAIGNQYFRYFKLANAEAITLSGQTSIRWIENRLNKYLNELLKSDSDYVIAVDTDSVYLNLGPVVDKFLSKQKDDKEKVVNLLDKICHDQLEPYIDKCYNELARLCECIRPEDADETGEHSLTVVSGLPRNDTS